MSINEIKKTMIQEFINKSIGNSASNLNKIFSSQIILQIPSIRIIGNNWKNKRFIFPKNEYLSCITMNFDGDIHGKSHIIITKKQVIQIITKLLKISLESSNFDTLMIGSMIEIGSVVIQSIVKSISAILCSNVEIYQPEYFESIGEILSHWNKPLQEYTQIEAYTLFKLESIEFNSYIFLYIEFNQFNEIADRLLQTGIKEYTGKGC